MSNYIEIFVLLPQHFRKIWNTVLNITGSYHPDCGLMTPHFITRMKPKISYFPFSEHNAVLYNIGRKYRASQQYSR